MSYILQALKKAERDRNRGQVPSLHDPIEPAPRVQTGSRSRLPRTAALLALVATLAAAHVYVKHLLAEKIDPPAQALPSDPDLEQAEISAPMRQSGLPVPVRVTPDAERTSDSADSEDQTAAAALVSIEESPEAEPIEISDALAPDISASSFTDLLDTGSAPTRSSEPESRTLSSPALEAGLAAAKSEPRQKFEANKPPVIEISIPETASKSRGSKTPGDASDEPPGSATKQLSGSSAQPDKASSDLPPDLNAMPAEFRADFPGMRIDVHVHDADPARRWVMINGEKAVEGMRITGGAVLEAITAQGIVVSLDGENVLLKVN